MEKTQKEIIPIFYEYGGMKFSQKTKSHIISDNSIVLCGVKSNWMESGERINAYGFLKGLEHLFSIKDDRFCICKKCLKKWELIIKEYKIIMQQHTKLYMNHFGFTTADFIPCEIPGCCKQAVDICHIDARGMGGNPSGSKNVIENLMAKCREHHLEYGDKKDFKEWLKTVHLQYMKDNGKN